MGLLNKSEDKIYTGSLLSKLILDITIYNYIKDGKVGNYSSSTFYYTISIPWFIKKLNKTSGSF